MIDKKRESKLLDWGKKEIVNGASAGRALNNVDAGLFQQGVKDKKERISLLGKLKGYRKAEDFKKAASGLPVTAQKSSFWLYALILLVIAGIIYYLSYANILALEMFSIQNFNKW
ncbi:hypothetical protein HY637_04740 [Candidatus Woesearchaeota archaeon]|nr:hypothetical protein [Candidatus Woesearchaeota archaeon]